ncbi:MAG: hypothetical protein JO261_08005 [Alphaproteobacteria bacterium]|nr:hypothetical protein [Alphaproteobacteria bacterium]MBV9693628.1 hypothetical protein [Alphaproteobacteria bacterium]
MGAFEHVISLLSFVYALAIAHLLTTAAKLIGGRERVRFSWLHAYWMFNALILLLADWISYWDMREVPNWTMPSILIVVVQSFVDYMQAALVCPEVPAEGTLDLVEFHRMRSRRYIGAFLATAIWAFIDNLYFGGAYNVSEVMRQNLATVPLIALAIAAIVFRNRVVQAVVPFLLLGVWAYYFTALQDALK